MLQILFMFINKYIRVIIVYVRRKIVNYFHVLQKIKVYYYTYLCLTFFFISCYCAYQIMFPNKNKLRKKYNDS